MDYQIEKTKWKENPILEIILNKKLVIKFGLSKAKAIIACIDEVRDFVRESEERNDKKN